MFHGAPFLLNKYISSNISDDIIADLIYTNEELKYADPFFEMIQMEEFWNKNMEDGFNPIWINFIYESMMGWFNKYSPGFMCVGRKPHPFGNERHRDQKL